MKWPALALVLASAPAWAQSTRYPASPVDKDAQAEARSVLWEQALHPGEREYAELVHAARVADDVHTHADAKLPLDELARAIHLMPDRPDAYDVRGELHLELALAAPAAPTAAGDWAACADDLAAADARSAARDPHRTHDLAICQARAGRYAAAEKTLVQAIAGASEKAELLVRLGEVRIAMGKLEEATETLDAALEAPDASGETQTFAHWLLALAYDRERRPSEAAEHADKAAGFDQQFNAIESPVYPLIGPGERAYLLGLAYETVPSPERSLMYFRRFLRLAPHSPWRRRAEEHVHALATLELPAELHRRSGNAPLALAAARAIVHRAMPAMRRCMAKLPDTVFEVIATRTGPPTPASARDQPHFHPPPAGATARAMLDSEATAAADQAAAKACIERLAARMPLPAPTERDSYYRIVFLVIAP